MAKNTPAHTKSKAHTDIAVLRPPDLFSRKPPTNPHDAEVMINEFFTACDTHGHPYTVPGLALWLGYSSRNSIHKAKAQATYGGTIKRALFVIELQRNEMLTNPRFSAAGVIFDLKNNFGWIDKQEITHNHYAHLTDDQLEQRVLEMQERLGLEYRAGAEQVIDVDSVEIDSPELKDNSE